MMIAIVIFFSLLDLIGHIMYGLKTMKGEIKPNLATWIPWILAPLLGAYFEIKAGGGISVLPIFMAGFAGLAVFIAGLITKNAFWKLRKLDYVCLMLSVCSLIFYIATRNLSVSIIFAILSDALAFIPTFKKTWTNPESEFHMVYSIPVLANIVALFVIKDWSFAIYSFGIYLIIFNAAELIIIYRKKITSTFSRTSAQ
jgi:hypothetical protein